MKWWKLKKEKCCSEFRKELRQALGGREESPDDRESTAEWMNVKMCLRNGDVQEQGWCAELQQLQRDKVDEPHEAQGKSC